LAIFIVYAWLDGMFSVLNKVSDTQNLSTFQKQFQRFWDEDEIFKVSKYGFRRT
jgi:hypothetical protein